MVQIITECVAGVTLAYSTMNYSISKRTNGSLLTRVNSATIVRTMRMLRVGASILACGGAFLRSHHSLSEQVVISVPEMHCIGCANTIRETLKKLTHVQRVTFDFPAKTVTAETVKPGQLTDTEIQAAVAKLNYKVANIARSDETK
jgi:copper chaperone CopZ